MNTPIKHEDIRDGDRVRMLCEYTSGSDAGGSITYELIERPVQLPTEPGWYLGYDRLAVKPFAVHVTRLGVITHPVNGTKIGNPERFAPFTLLRPVAEVAAEVLAEVRGANEARIDAHVRSLPRGASVTVDDNADALDAIAAKWARA